MTDVFNRRDDVRQDIKNKSVHNYDTQDSDPNNLKPKRPRGSRRIGKSDPRRRLAATSADTQRVAATLAAHAALNKNEIKQLVGYSEQGLTEHEVRTRLETDGPNEVVHDREPSWIVQLLATFKNPFVLILIGLALVMALTDDPQGSITIAVMVVISVLLRFWQEYRSGRAASALKAMVTTTCAVERQWEGEALSSDGKNGQNGAQENVREIPLAGVVVGDIVHLAAGDMIPADARILQSRDLQVSQATLSGESLPVEKRPLETERIEPLHITDAEGLALMGTSVTSGSATALVIGTGSDTYLGSMTRGIVAARRAETSFDIGVRKVSWVLIRFMAIMVPIVLAINGLTKGDWGEAALFAVAVAVGLTPEMLPVIVTANLAKGAVYMSRRKVIIKRLNAIQNLGAMDVLCTDKTGTLTEDRIVLVQSLDVHNRENRSLLDVAFLNSHYQTGLRNLLDQAVLDVVSAQRSKKLSTRYTLIDEIPFDFSRRRLSVVVASDKTSPAHLIVTKGAVEEMLSVCAYTQDGDSVVELDEEERSRILAMVADHNAKGFRVLAVATRDVAAGMPDQEYSIADEFDMTLRGFLTFLDPPKASAQEAISALNEHGVAVKVITGDNDIVARSVCSQVGIELGDEEHDRVVLGDEIELLTEDELSEVVGRASVFAKVTPAQKARIVSALQERGHVVGFLGDGVNDAAALRAADVSVSVDSGVDIAKESADIILLEKDLMVLETGVIEGRRTFGNIQKYIKMTASSNFGNVLSVLVASAFLPFLPMLAVQLLVQNLLYDLSQLAIPWDRMDPEYLRRPRSWDASDLPRFMLWIGPISSIFDITTYGVMWYIFSANTVGEASFFHSGWFVVGLLTQTLIVHMIRTEKIPFIQSRATLPLILTTVFIMTVGLAIPFTPFGTALGLVPLPWNYFPFLVALLVSYSLLTQAVKVIYIRRYGTWL